MKKLSDRIPMIFRAQISGRCQIQRLPNAQNDAYKWTDEWVEGVEEIIPTFAQTVQTREYEITWRFVTNSGQDEGVIRPVIGANGFPFYPGSSMKGSFSRACTDEEKSLYCGDEKDGTKPGILRFHGGYPKNLEWIDKELVDVVHPQESWQVKKSDNHSAFTQISLYQPTLIFGISSNKKLDDSQWTRIWEIWETAISQGIGSRVSAGYGQPKLQGENCLISIFLKGQGLASKLVNNEGEFRPNGFKAALRGHTLRLLGGVTDAVTAETLTKELWGGFAGKNGAIIGQLGISFEAIDLVVNNFTYKPGRNPFDMPIYNLKEGKLNLLSMKKISEKQQDNLKIFLKNLLQFSLLLGGFGKSWRRVDHRLFFRDYLENGDKPMIGCHWELIKQVREFCVLINTLEDVSSFLDKIHGNMKKFVEYKKKKVVSQENDWREAFHPNNVQVWGRIAEDKLDSEAIKWFHKNYQRDKTIKQSELTGKLNQIGRIWHRMYPQYIRADGKIKKTEKYIELLTIFPDNSQKTQDFLKYLQDISSFKKLWGGKG